MIRFQSTEEESSVNDTLEDRQSKDSASETNTEPGILKIEVWPSDKSDIFGDLCDENLFKYIL